MHESCEVIQVLVVRKSSMRYLPRIRKVGGIHGPVPCALVTPLTEGVETLSRYNGAITVSDHSIHAAQMIIQKIVLIFLGSTTALKMRLLSRCGVAASRCACSLAIKANSAARAHRALHQEQNPRF
jgi:sulfite exporter TauE/SafE